MTNQNFHVRIKDICRTLLEMATGKPDHRLPVAESAEPMSVKGKSDSARRISAKSKDVAVIRNLRAYIVENLEKPLPSLKELARLFGTNEFKLKQMFRHFSGTSIYKFYNEQRLNRAYSLIQQTDHSLKTVASMCGFQDYVTFSKAFKKRFGHSPGRLIRRPRMPVPLTDRQ